MEREQVVFVRCSFLPGGFPSERIFVIRSTDGMEWRGVAPIGYCFNRDRSPMSDEPAHVREIDGLVMGILLRRPERGISRVHLPDANVYELTDDFIVPVRSGDAEHVSI